jgi:hypothetical protein
MRTLFLALLFTASSFAGTPLESLLPGTDIKALQAVRQSGLYQLGVFEREVGKKKQVVVFLGETHAKSEAAGQMGRNLIAGFKGDIGVEGVNWDNMLFGSAIRPLIHGMHNVVGYTLFGSKKNDSTIVDALGAANKTHTVIRLEKNHQPDWVEDSSLMVIAAAVLRAGGELAVRGTGSLWWLGKSLFTTRSTNPVENQWKASLFLDRWKKSIVEAPSKFLAALGKFFVKLPENIVSIPSNCAQSVGNFLFLSKKDPTIGMPFWKRIAIRGDQALNKAIPTVIIGNLYLYLHPEIPMGLLGRRNYEMVNNAVDHWPTVAYDGIDTKEEDPQPLLVIAGMGHLHGWAHLLEERGFHAVPLD